MSEMTDSQGHHNAPLPQPVFAAVALVSCGKPSRTPRPTHPVPRPRLHQGLLTLRPAP